MTLDQLLSELHIEQAREVLQPHWDDSMNSLPAGIPGFLTPDEYLASRDFADMPPETDAVLDEIAQNIHNNPALVRLAWHCSRLLYDQPDYPSSSVHRWPNLEHCLGEQAGAFYLLIALAAMPRMLAIHRKLGIADAVSRQNIAYYYISPLIYAEKNNGRLGVDLRTVYWLRNHTSGVIFRLGRIEYILRPFHGRIAAFRHKTSREVIALAEDNTVYDAQGYFPIGEPSGEADLLTARLVEDDTMVAGYRIDPTGQATREWLQLPKEHWEPALRIGDTVLEMHIPAGGDLTPARCRDSMAWALDFFSRTFPDKPFAGFGCTSWIFNPEIAEFYSPTSNMVLWQQEMYLYPAPSTGRDGLYFIFHDNEIDLSTAPRDTSLQRAVIAHLQAGEPLRNGGAFLLNEDFRHYGKQHYRRFRASR